MNANKSKDNDPQVTLHPVTDDNWRDVAALSVTEAQRQFVAAPTYYLTLCCYGDLWRPLAVYLENEVIGFMMWAEDPSDGSCWLGGIIIDQHHQRRGYGRQAVEAAIALLGDEHGYEDFALSYAPDNGAKHLYRRLGFRETGEWEDEEMVARLSLQETPRAGRTSK
jgi:diamine N-acetyltransferase